ncbi:hypothetical protein K504DRAFT_272859 [Pleomassaria siparia CBS 279.74]|uniref:Secreted protein n=1 Tax=Pleomassaria siparia CBS 279.74 TaxID=1314801 RepID=A0A6G1K971_9PLEO|nr:hypothetical protein K504DRAFT_272859 [Pleomassaria siparia CBS 279.74]
MFSFVFTAILPTISSLSLAVCRAHVRADSTVVQAGQIAASNGTLAPFTNSTSALTSPSSPTYSIRLPRLLHASGCGWWVAQTNLADAFSFS